jgi:DNA modification methylase
MQIESVALNKIIPYIRNPRKNDNAVEKVASSIKEFGFRQPIVVDSENVIIAGHTRFEAAKRLGLDLVPVHVADGLTEQQVKAYRIADNRVGQEAEWDYDLLKLELEELDNPELTGFDEDELNGILAEVGEGLTDPDEVPEVPVEPVTVSGDLWELGEHRLLCGDATKSEDVERLMDGSKADMVFTDPPYGMNAVKNSGVLQKRYKNIINDDSTDVAIRSFNLMDTTIPAIWWGANYYANALPNASHWIVWDKNNGGSDQMDCELAWSNLKGVTRKFTQASEKTNRVHPTQKPVDLIVWSLDKLTPELVLDPFLGSGSTLIACQKTGRKCYGMEIDQHYCDVIITRWSEFTGKDDLLLNGKPFKWSERKIKKAA